MADQRMTEEERAAEVAALEQEVEGNSKALELKRYNAVRVDDEDLRAWDNIETAMAAFETQGMAIYLASEVIGSGYDVLDKAALVNTRMLLITWRFVLGDQGPFVVVTGITAELPARRFIFTDGGSGIFKQLHAETQRRITQGIPHINAGLLVSKGLVESKYDVETTNNDGAAVVTKASTFYLSTAQ